jgi:hypothetical protein
MDRRIFGGHNPQRNTFTINCATLAYSGIRLVASIPKIGHFIGMLVFRKAEAFIA